jgi:hypothetical protein
MTGIQAGDPRSINTKAMNADESSERTPQLRGKRIAGRSALWRCPKSTMSPA